MVKYFIIFLVALIILPALSYPFDYKTDTNGFKYVHHDHSESSYQHAYCSAYGGIEEYENKDKTRVDCLTKEHAIEFDFANKWAESIGQALHYSIMTGKKAKIVLILDKKYKKEQMIYVKRIKNIASQHNIDVDYVSDEILNIINDKCHFQDCKCNH